MFQRVCWRAILRALCVCVPCACFPLLAQSTNSWTNTTSGNWEDSHWSLGVLPGAGQSILVTNQGWKAIAIGPATAQNFSQTLNPYSVTLSSPTDSFNLLLLNYVGFQTPL